MRSRPKFGFTLIEILVAITLISAIAIIGTNLMAITLKTAAKAKASQLVKQEGNFAMLTLVRSIRNAQEIVSCSAESITLKNFDDTTSILYFDSSNEMIGQQNGSSTDVVNDRLTSSSIRFDNGAFDCIGSYLITIHFTLTQKDVNAREDEKASQFFSQAVTLRNY